MVERSTILNILSKALFDRPLQSVEETDWDILLEECQNQAILPLVYNTIKTQLPSEARQKWEYVSMMALATNLRVITAHASLHKMMIQSDIPYVILKGCAAARYYPQPGFRMMGDVDFLVAPEDVERCSQVLLAAGMTKKDSEPHPFHVAFSGHRVTYELHWASPGIPEVGGDKIRGYLRDTMQAGITIHAADQTYNVPDDVHHGLILLLHTAGHLTAGGIGLRHLCDWAVYIEQMADEMVYEALSPCLKECGLWEFARVLTAMSVRFLGASDRSWASSIDESLIKSLMEDIWSGGNFGQKDKHRLNYGVLGRDAKTRRISNRSTALSLLDAVKRRASLYYPALTDHVLTAPLAWGATGFRYMIKIVTGKRAPVRLYQDVVAVRERTELLRQLKLFE